jgi:hypothetical protein
LKWKKAGLKHRFSYINRIVPVRRNVGEGEMEMECQSDLEGAAIIKGKK